jgi:hypothetical protein
MSAPRAPVPTISCVEQYGPRDRDLFPEVRRVEPCHSLHGGVLAERPRQSHLAMAQAVGWPYAQARHHG